MWTGWPIWSERSPGAQVVATMESDPYPYSRLVENFRLDFDSSLYAVFPTPGQGAAETPPGIPVLAAAVSNWTSSFLTRPEGVRRGFLVRRCRT